MSRVGVGTFQWGRTWIYLIREILGREEEPGKLTLYHKSRWRTGIESKVSVEWLLELETESAVGEMLVSKRGHRIRSWDKMPCSTQRFTKATFIFIVADAYGWISGLYLQTCINMRPVLDHIVHVLKKYQME